MLHLPEEVGWGIVSVLLLASIVCRCAYYDAEKRRIAPGRPLAGHSTTQWLEASGTLFLALTILLLVMAILQQNAWIFGLLVVLIAAIAMADSALEDNHEKWLINQLHQPNLS